MCNHARTRFERARGARDKQRRGLVSTSFSFSSLFTSFRCSLVFFIFFRNAFAHPSPASCCLPLALLPLSSPRSPSFSFHYHGRGTRPRAGRLRRGTAGDRDDIFERRARCRDAGERGRDRPDRAGQALVRARGQVGVLQAQRPRGGKSRERREGEREDNVAR